MSANMTGEHVDLDHEELSDSHGRRITEQDGTDAVTELDDPATELAPAHARFPNGGAS